MMSNLPHDDPKMYDALTEIGAGIIEYDEREKLNYRLWIQYEKEKILIFRTESEIRIGDPVNKIVENNDNKRDVAQLIQAEFN